MTKKIIPMTLTLLFSITGLAANLNGSYTLTSSQHLDSDAFCYQSITVEINHENDRVNLYRNDFADQPIISASINGSLTQKSGSGEALENNLTTDSSKLSGNSLVLLSVTKHKALGFLPAGTSKDEFKMSLTSDDELTIIRTVDHTFSDKVSNSCHYIRD